MDYAALEKSLQRQVLSPVYLFYGEETYLREKILKRFKSIIPEEVRDFNMDIIDGRVSEASVIINAASTLPFMADKRVVIVKNADFFKATTADNVILEYLENPPDTTCLIFCTESVDRKRKVYKAIEKKGQVVEFSPLKGRDLNQWIDGRARNLGKVIEPAAIAGLITAMGNNLQQLSTELEKLVCYVKTEKISSSDVDNMVSKTAELSIFELVDAIGERQYKKAIGMAREMVFLGEPVIRIIFMIARQIRLLLQVKYLQEKGNSEQQITGELRVHPFVAQKCSKQARNFSLPELKSALEKVLVTDADIKTGKMEPVIALELLIISLCEKNKKGKKQN